MRLLGTMNIIEFENCRYENAMEKLYIISYHKFLIKDALGMVTGIQTIFFWKNFRNILALTLRNHFVEDSSVEYDTNCFFFVKTENNILFFFSVKLFRFFSYNFTFGWSFIRGTSIKH